MTLEELKAGINPSGLNPELEAKAEEYAKRDWTMNFKPVLERTGLLDDLELVSKVQDALFNLKYEYLANKESKEIEAKSNNLRWA